MAESKRVLCIGIDSMEKDLVIKWAGDGLLPNFASVFGRATWGETSCPEGMEAGAVWPSFNTGLKPGHHGEYFGNIHFDSESYKDFVFNNKNELTWEPFWLVLSRADKHVITIDAPYTYLQENINGICVMDWGTHARKDDSVFCTHPSSLAAEIEERFGLDTIGKCDDHPPRTAQEHIAFRENLIDRAKRKTALTSCLFEREDWDFFLTVYHEAHCIGHQSWHLHDPTHPKHNPELREAVGDPVKDVYVQIDACVGELLAGADDRTTVIIYISHGIEPMFTGSMGFLDDILVQLEKTKKTPVRDSGVNLVRKAWVNTPAPIRDLMMPLRGRVLHRLSDKAHRRFFEQINNFATAGIRINLIGREKDGMIEPGAEYDAICEQLIEDMSAFKNADNGHPLFREILKTADLYEGDHVHLFPDLLLRWNREIPIKRVYSPKTGLLENTHEYSRTGDHSPAGLFFAVGPSLAPSALNRVVPAIDFAPTFCALLGVDFQGFDGRKIGELC